jgi:3-hydroxy-3-methylglutaryl CoA synthase
MAIVAAGAYVPYRRLPRGAIARALGTPAAPGTRAVASYDEDTTTMGVEAARLALDGLPAALAPRTLLFATADPAYLDKTNASAIHAALGRRRRRRVRRRRIDPVRCRRAGARRRVRHADPRGARGPAHGPARRGRRARRW